MNKRIAILLAVPMVMGLVLVGLVGSNSNPNPAQAMQAKTKITRHIFRGVGDMEVPWLYIYVNNPTWQTVNVTGVQIDTYVNGVYHPEISYFLPPFWPPTPTMGWDTMVLPFENSVGLYLGWIVEEGEPTGVYDFDITVYATVMAEDIELKTGCTFQVFL